MTSSCSLLFKDVKERAPTGVQDALCQMMILDHVENLKLLNRNDLVLFGVLFGRLIVEVPTLPFDLEMGLCCTSGCLAPSMTALLATRDSTLLPSKGFLTLAIIARVLNGMALTIGQEGCESDINADIGM